MVALTVYASAYRYSIIIQNRGALGGNGCKKKKRHAKTSVYYCICVLVLTTYVPAYRRTRAAAGVCSDVHSLEALRR